MSEELCHRCQAIGWHQPDENVFKSYVTRDETVHDLIARQPCAFCRLMMHFLSPKEPIELIAEARNGSAPAFHIRYKAVYFGEKISGRRAVTVLVPQPDGLMTSVGHVYSPLSALASGPSSIETLEIGSRQIPSNRILRWIGECDKEHTRCATLMRTVQNSDEVPIKLIDIAEMEVARAKSTWRYIALSYVWGTANLFQTNRRNIGLLEEPGALYTCLDKIPQTIRDAMQVVGILGERFLWVDSICIAQDDAVEKHRQIQQMDVIYAKAYLTIIAASGKDSTSGLPGVSLGSRSSPRAVETVGGVTLIAEPLDSVADAIPLTIYETRGWTFQERILSSRCLFLTNKLVMFQCQIKARTEISEKDLDPDFVNPLIRISMPPDSLKERQWSTEYQIYVAMVSCYSLRQLSYQSDMLNAFTGVMSWITRRNGTQFSFGLPERHFDSALLWTGERHDQKVDTATTKYSSVSDLFPSWSWTNSKGPVTYRLMSLRESYLKYDSACPILCSNIARFEVKDSNGAHQIQREIYKAPGLPPATYGTDHADNSGKLFLKNEGILRFKSAVTSFNRFKIDLKEEPLFKSSNNLADYAIRDINGDICGALFDMTVTLRPQLLDPKSSLFSYVRLSSVFISSEAILSAYGLFSKSAASGKAKYRMSDWSIINVMLIRWKDDTIAERVGLCQMHSDAWDNASSIERMISLV